MTPPRTTSPAAPPLEGCTSADRAEALDGGPRTAAPADGRDQALRAVQVALIKEIDAAISKLERARMGESTREHLEILRSLLKAQVTAYLEHFVARRATLFSHTSMMYAGEVGGSRRDLHHLPRAARGRHAGRRAGRQAGPAPERPAHPDHLRRPRHRQVDPAQLAVRAHLRGRAIRRRRARARPAGAQGALVLRAPGRGRRHRHAGAVRQGPAHGPGPPRDRRDARPGGRASSSASSPTTHAPAASPRCARRRCAARWTASSRPSADDPADARDSCRRGPAGVRAHALGREGPAAPRRHLERRGPGGRRTRCSARCRPARRPPASWSPRPDPGVAATLTVPHRHRVAASPFPPSGGRGTVARCRVRAGMVPVHDAARRLFTPAPASRAGAVQTTGGDWDKQV